MPLSPRHHPLHHLLRRPLAVWLAVLIAVFGALAPTVTHALARSGLLGGIEVCSSTGPQIIPANSPTGPETALSLVHCPFCLHSTDRIAPPPSLLPYLFSVQGGQQEVRLWQAFFFVPLFAPTPPPRGPPSIF